MKSKKTLKDRLINETKKMFKEYELNNFPFRYAFIEISDTEWRVEVYYDDLKGDE